MSRFQDASKREIEEPNLGIVIRKLLANTVEFTTQETSYLQFLLQELIEINGSLSSTANEKQPVKLGMWRPQLELSYTASIANKLGAALEYNMPAPDVITQRTSPYGNQ